MTGISREAKQTILKVAKRMDEKGLVNSYEGNLSIKKDGLLYITPTEQNKAWLTEEMIAVIDENGKQIDGTHKYSSELPMHIATYSKRKKGNIHAVIHCHATYLTCYAICREPIECVYYQEHIMGFNKIPLVPYGQPRTDEIHEGIGDLFESTDIVLLANHGLLAVGETLEDALATVEAAEHSAQIYATVRNIGTPVDIEGEDLLALQKWHEKKVNQRYR